MSPTNSPRRQRWRALLNRLTAPRGLTALTVTLAVVATLIGAAKSDRGFNNFDIFRWSFDHLRRGLDLYAFHRDRHVDLFKYSPTFALLMAPFWALPRLAGVTLWNGLNALAPCLAVRTLKIGPRAQSFVLLFALVELMTSVQNAQSNGLVVALMIGAFAAFEAERVVLAAVLIALGCAIKPFVAAAGLLFLLRGHKGRFLGAGALSGLALILLPLPLTGREGLIGAYRAWFHLVTHDPPHEANYSLMSLAETWLGLHAPTAAYLVPGLVLLLAPLARRSLWGDPGYRLLTFAGILLWVVILNPKAESPTYVIAAYGAALWGLAAPRTPWRLALLVVFVLLTELSATDLFPRAVRVGWVQPYRLKALPSVLIWLTLAGQLLTARRFPWPEPEAIPASPSVGGPLE